VQSYRHADIHRVNVSSRGSGFDLLTSGSVHVEVLPWTIRLLILVLTAQAVSLLERRQTDKQTDMTERPTHVGRYTAGVGNNNHRKADVLNWDKSSK